jgi:hypothetical protein
MDGIAVALDRASGDLADAERRLRTAAEDTVDAPDPVGGPGRLGADLHERWRGVLGALADDAYRASVHVADLAESVRAARRAYEETDLAAHRRLGRGTL